MREGATGKRRLVTVLLLGLLAAGALVRHAALAMRAPEAAMPGSPASSPCRRGGPTSCSSSPTTRPRAREPRLHATGQGAPRRPGDDLLPLSSSRSPSAAIAGHDPPRPVSAQPQDLHQRPAGRRLRPLPLPGAREQDPGPRPPGGRLPDLFRRQVHQWLPRTWRTRTYIPPGWDEWHVPSNDDAYSEFNYELNERGALAKFGAAPTDYLTDVLRARSHRFPARHGARRSPSSSMSLPTRRTSRQPRPRDTPTCYPKAGCRAPPPSTRPT